MTEDSCPSSVEAHHATKCLRKRFDETGALKRSRVISYCGGGIAATTNAFALLMLGQPNVAVYDGSLDEWSRDPSLPMETDAEGS